MANRLKIGKINAILTLHEQGWSPRRIAEQLGIRRETEARYVAAGSKPAKAPPGSAAENRPQAPPGSGRSRSDCEPYCERILEKLKQGLSAQRIY